MVDFFGRFFANLNTFVENPILMILMYVLMAMVITFPALKKEIENVMVSPYMKDELLDIRKKFKNDNDKKIDAIRDLIIKYSFGQLASPVASILELLFGLFLGISMYSDSMKALNINLFGTSGYLSPCQYFGTGLMEGKLSTLLFVAALVVQYFHDRIVEGKLIVEQNTMDVIVLVICGAVLFLMPNAMVWYWLMFEILEFALLFFYQTTRRAYIEKRVDLLRTQHEKAAKKEAIKKASKK